MGWSSGLNDKPVQPPIYVPVIWGFTKMVSGRIEAAQDQSLYSNEIKPKKTYSVRSKYLPQTPQNREYVQAIERLASHSRSLRSMRSCLHVRHHYRRNLHLLDLINES
jgi:hypothetical protein